MKKILGTIISILLGYLVSYYTTGQEKGYPLLGFHTSFSEQIAHQKNAELLQISLEHIKYYQYQEALELLLNILNNDPDHWDAIYYTGHAYLKLEQYQNAHEYLTRAVYLHPNSFEAALDMGICMYYLENYQLSVENLSRAVLLKDDVKQTYLANYYLAASYWKLREREQALVFIRAARMAEPEYYGSHILEAAILIDAMQYQKAIELLNSIYENKKNEPDFQTVLARAYFGKQNTIKALHHVDTALIINPQFDDAIVLNLTIKKMMEP